MTSAATLQRYLDCPMDLNDANALTVGGYFLALAEEVWREGEGFSGKRPFGDSGWEAHVYNALCIEGLMSGTKEDDDYWWETTGEEENRINRLLLSALNRAKITVGE